MSGNVETYQTAEPLSVFSDYTRAEQAIRIRRYDKAIEAMQRVLLSEPADTGAYLLMARAYLLKGELTNARKNIQKALSFDPENAYAHALYGYIQGQTKSCAEAEKEFEIALMLDPHSGVANYWYGYFLLEKRNHPKK